MSELNREAVSVEEAFAGLPHLAEEVGVQLNEQQIQLFRAFYEELIETNKVMNLTAITQPDEVILKHFADSLSLTRVHRLEETERVLDLGTGGGFPGIPLKIAYPGTEFVLADSLNKRIKFLNGFIEKNSLQKINGIHGRAEELARKGEYREQFDVVVSRAVANLSTLCEYCLPFVKVGGAFISYKSGDVEEELTAAKTAIRILGGKCEQVDTFRLPDSDIDRSLIVIRKIAKTPKTYPRKAGSPSKDPLGNRQ